MGYKNLGFKSFLVFALLVASIFLSFPLEERINLGLDLEGGMHLVYNIDTEGLSKKEKKGISQRAVETIRNRIDELGVKEPVIQPQGQHRILVQLPGVVNRDRALQIIGKTALLEFKLVEDDSEVIKKNQSEADSEHIWKEYEDERILLKKKALLTGKALSGAQVSYGSGFMNLPQVSVEFNSEGAKRFAEITGKHTGQRLAILLDGKVETAPAIRETIHNGQARITGDFSKKEATTTAMILRAGALPCPLHVEEERTVGPLLGQDSIEKGVKAIILGGIVVSVFVLIYYLFAGVVCILALIFDLLLILAGLSLFGATLTLPGIAGILLTVGMAVDANVLIYERIREELRLKKPLSMAIRLGYDRAFRTILDSNVTTLIAAVLLFIFGTGPIKGFGVTLSLGIIASMFTALVFTRVIFEFLVSRKIIKNLFMLRLVGNTKFRFVSKGKIFLVVSLVVLASGGYFFNQEKGDVFGIDFKGGQIQEYKFDNLVSLEELRTAFSEKGLSDISLYNYAAENTIGIKGSKDTYPQVKQVLENNYKGQYEIMRIERVGPIVGRLLRNKAIFAIIFAILGILFYVTIRFKHFNFGFAAIIALFHDVLIALAFLVFFSYKIDLLIVTALLTIAGYSINDTIVVYDRIRELTKRFSKQKLPEIIDKALNQTLSRTFITSLTTFVIVLCLFLYGSQNLSGFSFCLLVGIVSGTYSSLFIASPLVVFFRRKS